MRTCVPTVHTAETIEEVLALARQGLGARRISAQTGVPVRTVTDWLRGRTPRAVSDDGCLVCGGRRHRIDEPKAYVYLLGLYLGDGYVASHARGVQKLRITLDVRYTGIIDECAAAMKRIVPRNRVHQQRRRDGCVEVGAYSRGWGCLLPQVGPGKKHERRIVLEHWQWLYVELHPEPFLRGLIHSDGCRFINTGRNWSHPRYEFANTSKDIKGIFCATCDLLGLHWTATKGKSIYVSRKIDVARMDEFIGPKG
jgi:hypothetical protein